MVKNATNSRRYLSKIVLLLLLLITGVSFGQSTANYTFSTATDGSLTDMSSGTTQLLAGGQDDVASSVVNIGFTYILMGTPYTQFSVNSNGAMGLGSTLVPTSGTSTGTTTAPKIAPFGGDQGTITSGGKVHYKVIGSAPNRVLVVEWLNMKMNYTNYATALTGDGTYQALLYETSGIVEFIYGNMTVATTFTTGPVVGISAGTSAGQIASVTTSTNAVTTNGTAWINNSYSVGNIANLHSTSDGTRRVYSFTPGDAPLAPSGLNFTSVTLSGMTLNWTDNSANELGFTVYRSDDGGTTYNYITKVAAGTVTYAATGLLPGTTYHWQVKSLSEGRESSSASNSQATNAASLSGTRTVGTGGDYATLTAALLDLTNQGLAGSVILELTTNFSGSGETLPLTLSNFPGLSASNTLTIRPALGVTGRSIILSQAGPIFDFNGGKYITIDGRPGGTGSSVEFTIQNNNTSNPAIRFINDANNNNIRYCNVKGAVTTTSSGVILFSTTTGTNGNDNNTIEYCNVSDANTTPSNLIYSSGTTTTTAHFNSGNIIQYNNIYNFYSSSTHTGIYLTSGNTDWTISNNSLYQTTNRAPVAVTCYGIYINNTTSGNNFTVSNNYIGGTAANCGGTAWTVNSTATAYRFIGIQLAVPSTGTASNIQGNTIQNMVWYSSSGATTAPYVWCGIYISAGSVNIGTSIGNTIGSGTGTGSVTATITTTGGFSAGIQITSTGTVDCRNNIIGSVTIQGSTTLIGHSFRAIDNSSAGTITIQNNTIGSTSTGNSINLATATGGTIVQEFSGIRNASGSATMLISTNTVANINNTTTSTSASSITRGITTAGTANITGNTIRNLSTSSAGTSGGASATVMGISVSGSSGTISITQNVIHTLSNTNSGAVAVQNIGIAYASTSTTASTIAKNLIHSLTLSSASTTAGIMGISHTGSGSLTTYQNNMVRLGLDAAGNPINTGYTIDGIYESVGANNFYFNTVYIGGTSVDGTTGNTHALRSIVTVNNRKFQNNILFNARSGGTTGKHYAIRLGGTGANPSGLTSNYNCLYSTGTVQAFLGYYDLADRSAISDWKLAIGQDANSFSGNPQLINPTGTSANLDLHIHATNPTPIESSGLAIDGITDDYDGHVRADLTPTDIGADAGNFIPSDISGPVINYTALGNTSLLTNRTLSSVTITDASGVNVTEGTKPRIYFKRSGDANTFADNTSGTDGWKYVETSSDASPFSFTINNSLLNGGTGVTPGTEVQYFVVAQDLADPVNVGIHSGTFTKAPTSVDLTADAFPLGGTIRSYTIIGSISGDVFVGTGQTYESLTADAENGLFKSINSKEVTGNITVKITSDITETGAIALNQWSEEPAGSNFTITIQPSEGVNKTISGSYAGGLIRLNGADRVTFDGRFSGSGSYLTIRNSNTSNPVLTITNGSINNTFRNTVFEGASTSTSNGVIFFSTGINTNNLITECEIKNVDASNMPAVGIYFASTDNSSNTISKSKIYNFSGYGMFLSTTGALEIEQNEIYQSTASGSATVYGIHISNSSTNLLKISRNKIYSLNGSASATIKGIYYPGSSGVNSNVSIENNIISLSPTTTGTVDGIDYFGYVANSLNLYYNTIYLGGSLTSGTNGSYGIRKRDAATTFNIKDNIVFNTRTNSGGTGSHYSIFVSTTTGTLNFNYNDYFVNGTGGGVLGYWSASNQATIGDWRTASSQDANSININPEFQSAADLRPNLGNGVLATGNPVSGITVDYLGTARSETTPSMGAYENGTDASGPTISYTVLGNTTSTSNRNFTNVTITDPSGVNTTSGTRPRIYYKKSTDNNEWNDNTSGTNGWKWAEANGTSSPFDFTIDYSKLNGGSVAAGQTIQYFVTAQDLQDPAYVSINSGTFAAPPVSVGLTSGAFPLGGSINSYNISVAFTGTISVGGGQTYTSLTADAADGLFRQINTGVLTGNLTVNVTSNLTETGAIALNQWSEEPAGSNFTITIQPSEGVNKTLSADYAGGLIRLNGADRVTFDGRYSGSGSYLTVNNTSTSSSAAFQLISLGAGLGATNNIIRNCNISTGTSAAVTYGVHIGGSSMGSTGADNDSNSVINNTITVASNGIYASGTVATSSGAADYLSISGNSVTCNTSVAAIGIRLVYSLNTTISQNTLDIRQSVSNAPVAIAIETGVSNTVVSGNYITRSAYTGTSGYGGRGITVGTGSAESNITIINNAIYGVTGDNYSGFSASSSMGIAIGVLGNTSTLTTTTGGVNIYFNSVNMYGTYNRANACLVTALYIGSSSSALNIKNNVFANSMDNTGTASKSYAIYSAATNAAFTSINYNDYYASGSEAVFGYLSSDKTDLTAWQTATAQDVNSISVDPLFTSSTNLRPQVNSTVLAAGNPVVGITTDILGTTRNVTTPSIGAYETGTDAPVISYTTLGNINSTSNRTLSGVTITTNTIPVNFTTNKPRVYYKKSTDNNVFGGNTSGDNGWKWRETTSESSPAEFTIDYSIINGASVSAGELIQYFVAAQNTSGTPEVSSNPVTGFVATSVSAITSAPTTPNQYKVVGPPLTAGDYTVGTEKFNEITGLNLSYKEFTRIVEKNNDKKTISSENNKIDAPDDEKNVGKLSGFINEAVSNLPKEDEVSYISEVYYELVTPDGDIYNGPSFIKTESEKGVKGLFTTLTAAIADLNERGLAGSVRFLLTDATYNEAAPLNIEILAVDTSNASKTVTIKPNLGVTSTINVNSTSPVLTIGNSYVIIDGSNANDGTTRDLTLINAGSGTSSGVVFVTATTNVTVKNIIGKASASSVAYGIVYNGSAYGLVQNCEIKKTALGIQSQSTSTNFTVRNCDVGSTVAEDKIQDVGISVLSSQTFVVSNNRIFGITRSSTASVAGIVVGNQTGGTEVQTGWIHANKIYDIKHTGIGLTAYGAHGIRLAAVLTTANITVYNNMISDILADGDGGVLYSPHGIYIPSGGNYNIWFNTINMFGALGNENYDDTYTSAICVYSGTAVSLDIKNNIFRNSQTISGGTSYAFAIYSLSANTAFSAINYNNYYVSGANAMLGYLGSNRVNLSAWQTATGKDAKSKNVDVTFTSTTDLHLAGGSVGDKNLQGQVVVGFTKDYDNQDRHAAYPYMGMDEVTTNPLALTLNLTVLIEGFMNGDNSAMTVGDTISVSLRGASAPFALVDSAAVVVDANGQGNVYFAGNSQDATNYYLQVRHRNSIETWSAAANPFTSYSYSFDFTNAQNKAYGDNMIQKGTKWCIYGGDVNQDGIVDGSDITAVDNDATNWASGYLRTDTNGDEIVDGSDITQVDNNATNWIGTINPVTGKLMSTLKKMILNKIAE
ncbi:MAG: fibronectin type III domain-containing protein [Ignavibacteriaceae bacterium]